MVKAIEGRDVINNKCVGDRKPKGRLKTSRHKQQADKTTIKQIEATSKDAAAWRRTPSELSPKPA